MLLEVHAHSTWWKSCYNLKLAFTKGTALIQEDRVNLMIMFNCAGVQSEFM